MKKFFQIALAVLMTAAWQVPTFVTARALTESEPKPPMSCPYVGVQSASSASMVEAMTYQDIDLNTIQIKNKLGADIRVDSMTIEIEHNTPINAQADFQIFAVNPITQVLIANMQTFTPISSTKGLATFQFTNTLNIKANKQKNVQLLVSAQPGVPKDDTIHAFRVIDVQFTNKGSVSQLTGCPNFHDVRHGNTVLANNHVPLNTVHLYETGRVKIATGSTIPGKILVPNDEENIFAINFTAGIDDIEVSDIYLENDANDDETTDNTAIAQMFSFKLFDQDFQLLQQEQMSSNGKIEFELQNGNHIMVPKNGSRTVFIKAESQSNFPNNFTERQLRLSVDTDNGSSINGIEAVSATNGIQLNTTSVSGDATSNEFLLHNSKFSIQPASTQPTFIAAGPNPTQGNAIYRFQITADRDMALQTLAFDINVHQAF